MSRCLSGPAVVNRGDRAELDRQVDGLGVSHASDQQVDGFANDGVLQAIDQKTGTILVNAQGDAAKTLPNFARAIHGRVRGLVTANNLDDGDDMPRVAQSVNRQCGPGEP